MALLISHHMYKQTTFEFVKNIVFAVSKSCWKLICAIRFGKHFFSLIIITCPEYSRRKLNYFFFCLYIRIYFNSTKTGKKTMYFKRIYTLLDSICIWIDATLLLLSFYSCEEQCIIPDFAIIIVFLEFQIPLFIFNLLIRMKKKKWKKQHILVLSWRIVSADWFYDTIGRLAFRLQFYANRWFSDMFDVSGRTLMNLSIPGPSELTTVASGHVHCNFLPYIHIYR